MRPLTITKLLLATSLFAASSVVLAQTSSTAGTPTAPAMGSNQPATSIGVTPQAAAEANRQAVPRADTGTVVRTAPNAVDSMRSGTGTTSSMGSTGTGTTANMNTGNTGSMNTNANPGTTPRAPRADRN